MCFKYLTKGGIKLLKADRYDQLIDQVLGKRMVVADPKEIELANRLLIVKKINVRRLQMEIKQLKEFGKEVGLKLAQMNKMEEEPLILEIIRNVEPKVQYSKELVSWYNELDDTLFDQAEAESGAAATADASNEGGVSIVDVIEVINGYKKKAELLEIIEDNDVAPLFKGFDATPYKLPTQLKKAMIDHLETPPETVTKEVEDAGEDKTAEILELINECENEDQLVEVYSEYQTIFEDMEVPDDVDEAVLQEMMIAHVNSKAPAAETAVDKPMSLQERLAAKKAKDAEAASGKANGKAEKEKPDFSWWTPEADDFDANAAFAVVEEMKMTLLRQFAKHIGLSIGIGKKKDEILDIVANKIAEFGEGVTGSTGTGEVQITEELINDAAKGKDKEALVEMCDQLGIKLNALQKKSVPGMKAKLIEAIADQKSGATETTTVKDRTKLSAKKEDAAPADQSIYSVMETMVLASKSEDAIVKKVSPLYKEKGKSIIFIKKRVTTMIQIIKIDNDLE